jgi:hypothetical protein
MKTDSKLITGAFVLAFGFGLVAIGGCKSSSMNATSGAQAEPSTGQNIQLWVADKGIDLRFKEFQQAKDLLAVFELTNKTRGPILYEAYSFTDNIDTTHFCQLAAKQSDLVRERTVSDCRYANNIALVALDPGATVSFAAPKWEIKETLNLPSDASEIAAQIGFEIFVGDQRRKQIVWSDTIVFPKTISITSQ